MTYFYISLGAFILYLACKTSYKLGKDEGVQIGFQIGKEYGKTLQKNMNLTSTQQPKYYSNSTAEWEFKKHRQN